MKDHREISPYELENAMKLIGKTWMLITAKDEENGRVNAMTASWGAMGVLWNKPVCVAFIRPQRHTYSLVEKEDRLSFAFLGEENRSALAFCGRESGRNCDKLAATGLSTVEIDGVACIKEAKLLLVCKKLYAQDLGEDCFIDKELLSNYTAKDYHRMYVCEIEKAYVK
jgi:flavin reductase (DIM6/NTAB) family NADH-FMN oxidoreductase RutF